MPFAFHIEELFKLHHFIKIPELVSCLLTLDSLITKTLVYCFSKYQKLNHSLQIFEFGTLLLQPLSGIHGANDKAIIFGSVVVYGFFFVTLIQVISILKGEKAPIMVINQFHIS